MALQNRGCSVSFQQTPPKTFEEFCHINKSTNKWDGKWNKTCPRVGGLGYGGAMSKAGFFLK